MTDATRTSLGRAVREHVAMAQGLGISHVSPPAGSVEVPADPSAASAPPPSVLVTGTPRRTIPPEDVSAWERLEAEAKACTRCGLAQGRQTVVFGSGAKNAALMFIGEAPGADEDRQGLPFVGRAGQLLTKMIEAMGYSRDGVYIANIIKCRPPDNRPPLPEETAACIGFLQRQVALVRPRIICALGRTAANGLLGDEAPLGSRRGRLHQALGVPVLVTYHPAYLLRSPDEKVKAWEDLKRVRDFLTKGA